MNYKERRFYKKNLNEVLHTTLNPYEPGVVRIHLVPAKYNPFKANPSVVILNGKDILPINLSWTILLAIFIKEVNAYKGGEVTENQLQDVVTKTVNKAFKIYKTAADKTHDTLSMYRLYRIYKKDFEKFNLKKRNLVLEKFYLMKCYSYLLPNEKTSM